MAGSEDQARGDDPLGIDKVLSTYNFNTAVELIAFMQGVEAMDGWMAYEVIEP